MFSNHLSQFVHLVSPEYPKVFTNFENQVGEYSVACKKAKEDFVIIDKIAKNQLNYDLIVQYTKSKVYDIIHIRAADHITEDYGAAFIDCVKPNSVGDTVKEGSTIYKTSNYLDNGCYGYGVNLKAVFIPYLNRTFEDAIVISKSAAEKLTSYKVEQTTVMVSTIDVMLNLYGDETTYKSFPEVGDMTGEHVLVALRRENNRNVLYNFQSDRMRRIDEDSDQIIYTNGGKVVDIDICSNVDLDKLKSGKNDFCKEASKVIEEQNSYYTELAHALEKVIPVATERQLINGMTAAEKKAYEAEKKEYGASYKHPLPKRLNPNQYTDELGFYWKKAHEYIDPDIKWKDDQRVFDGFKMTFTILKENPLVPGSKLSGRYGNKGVVSLIEDDDKMPMTEDGVRADVCLNSLGIINRLNLAQIQEQHINFMSDHVVKIMKGLDNLGAKADVLFDYMKSINKTEYDFFYSRYATMSRAKKEEFIKDIEDNGIYIHQPPFFGNTTMQQFVDIFEKHPEWCSLYNMKGIERKMVLGDMYFIRLKHEPANKSSARSASILNIRDLPSKSNLKKDKRQLVASTPIRLGEMETDNLMLTKRGDIVAKELRETSSSPADREALIKALLESEDPMNVSIKMSGDKNINRKTLDKYLEILDLAVDDEELSSQK
jgi:DNA-directed RNA polymerase beta subunit